MNPVTTARSLSSQESASQAEHRRTSRRPNLFIVGAMKSGTTSLHSYLGAHPEIFMSAEKEPEYFAKESVWSRGEDWYLSLFSEAKDHTIVGESSTTYARLPHFQGVAERIAKFNPDARFVYIMRDPVERSISQYWFRVRFCGERRDMLAAVREDARYIDVGNYALQLQPYFELFGSQRVATLTFEELASQPINAVQRLFAWLGVDPSVVPANCSERENVTPGEIVLTKNSGIEGLARSRAVRKLKSLFPSAVISVVNRWSGRYEYIDRNSTTCDQVVDFLRPIQRDQIRALVALLGREFPEWRTLYSEGPRTPDSLPSSTSSGFVD
jgi:Sulfotransferase family